MESRFDDLSPGALDQVWMGVAKGLDGAALMPVIGTLPLPRPHRTSRSRLVIGLASAAAILGPLFLIVRPERAKVTTDPRPISTAQALPQIEINLDEIEINLDETILVRLDSQGPRLLVLDDPSTNPESFPSLADATPHDVMNAMERPGPMNSTAFRNGFAWLPSIVLVAGVLASVPDRAAGQALPARQITVFGVLATPGGGEADPKLAPVLPRLRRLLPNHGFKLIKIESQRAVAGQSVTCNLGDGFLATSQLVDSQDVNGKVQMRFNLTLYDESQFQTVVTTPPDQVMFCEKMLPNGSRLLIGLGAR